MCGDQFREFVCGYWDLKGQGQVASMIVHVFLKPMAVGLAGV